MQKIGNNIYNIYYKALTRKVLYLEISERTAPELKAVYSGDIGKPSLSGSNQARKPTLQVNEGVCRKKQATRVEPRIYVPCNRNIAGDFLYFFVNYSLAEDSER